MKYDPRLAYRALEWCICTFTKSEERAMWIACLGLVGAICTLWKKLGM